MAMRQDIIGRTISWSLGFVLPLFFVAMGLLSIALQRSAVPMSKGYGRFALGATEASGTRAVLMGIAYIGFAALLSGSLFEPLRRRHERMAVCLQVAGFFCAFVVFGYVLRFSKG